MAPASRSARQCRIFLLQIALQQLAYSWQVGMQAFAYLRSGQVEIGEKRIDFLCKSTRFSS